MKHCISCHKENRNKALFCRHCGMELALEAPSASQTDADSDKEVSMPAVDTCDDALSSIVGMEAQKAEIREFLDTVLALMSQRGKKVLNMMNLNILITGPAGSGKKKLTQSICAFMAQNDIIDPKKGAFLPASGLENIDFSQPEQQDMEIISLDDAHKLLPTDRSSDPEGALDYLLTYAADALVNNEHHFIIVVNGSPELQSYIDERPTLKALFGLNVRLSDYSASEVTGICEAVLKERYSISLNQQAREKLERVFNFERRNSDRFGNAHLAISKANELLMAATRRGKGKKVSKIISEDISGKEYVPKSLDDVLAEFDKYVGVDDIKKALLEIVNNITAFKKLNPDKEYEVKDHFIFQGNPGTGKTTMARVFADALNALGILPSGQLIEVASKDLIGQYLGHTGPKVDAAFDRAMGGVLFIDEAYDLQKTPDDQFGIEAVTALIKNVEDRRGKLIVILAGYQKEMEEFATYNPGIPSRFNEVLNFRDYDGAEMTEIARRMIKAEGYSLDPDSENPLQQFFEKMCLGQTKDFANARDVRNAVGKAIKNHNSKIARESSREDFDRDSEFVLSISDFTGTDEKPPLTVDEVLAKLDDLIGMTEIKLEIRKLANVAMVNRKRMELGIGSASLQPVNIILTGNPGTGKTTIAKRLGEVLHAAGVLKSDKVVEREAKTILSSYVNASGQNMDKAVDEAMGGVLFIDEAYNLLPAPGSQNNTGNEALDALMTRMEKDKGKFVVVIAGYADRMEELVRRGNPGLMSRFNKRFHIDDYSAEELTEIFRLNLRKRRFTMTPEAECRLKQKIEAMVDSKGLHFGNAREVVNLLNEIIELQGNRIVSTMNIANANQDALTTIEASDIPD